jgi:hypothetical protein
LLGFDFAQSKVDQQLVNNLAKERIKSRESSLRVSLIPETAKVDSDE